MQSDEENQSGHYAVLVKYCNDNIRLCLKFPDDWVLRSVEVEVERAYHSHKNVEHQYTFHYAGRNDNEWIEVIDTDKPFSFFREKFGIKYILLSCWNPKLDAMPVNRRLYLSQKNLKTTSPLNGNVIRPLSQIARSAIHCLYAAHHSQKPDFLLMDSVEVLALYTIMNVKQIVLRNLPTQLHIEKLTTSIKKNLSLMPGKASTFFSNIRDYARLYQHQWQIDLKNGRNSTENGNAFNSILLIVALKCGLTRIWVPENCAPYDGSIFKEFLETHPKLSLQVLCNADGLFPALMKPCTHSVIHLVMPNERLSILEMSLQTFHYIRILELGSWISDKKLCCLLWKLEMSSDKILQKICRDSVNSIEYEVSLPHLEILRGNMLNQPELQNPMYPSLGAVALVLQRKLQTVECLQLWSTFDAIVTLLEMETKYKGQCVTKRLNVSHLKIDLKTADLSQVKKVVNCCPNLNEISLSQSDNVIHNVMETMSWLITVVRTSSIKRLSLDARLLIGSDLLGILSEFRNVQELTLHLSIEEIVHCSVPIDNIMSMIPDEDGYSVFQALDEDSIIPAAFNGYLELAASKLIQWQQADTELNLIKAALLKTQAVCPVAKYKKLYGNLRVAKGLVQTKQSVVVLPPRVGEAILERYPKASSLLQEKYFWLKLESPSTMADLGKANGEKELIAKLSRRSAVVRSLTIDFVQDAFFQFNQLEKGPMFMLQFLSAFKDTQELNLRNCLMVHASFLVFGCLGGSLATLLQLKRISIISCIEDITRDIRRYDSGPHHQWLEDHFSEVARLLPELTNEKTFKFLKNLEIFEIDEFYVSPSVDKMLNVLRMADVHVKIVYRPTSVSDRKSPKGKMHRQKIHFCK